MSEYTLGIGCDCRCSSSIYPKILLLLMALFIGGFQISSAFSEIYMISIDTKNYGYDVYVDEIYIGTEGAGGDLLDGTYIVNVTGNSQHSIFADDGKFRYGLTDFFFVEGVPYLFSVGDPSMILGPSNYDRNFELLKPNAGSDMTSVLGYETPSSGSSIASNQPPSIISLSPSVSSPQEVGASITWTAQAIDPENDSIYYQFWISGPRTGDEWQMIQNWSQNSTWTWWTSQNDVGTSDVQLRIRDGLHANSSDMDDFNEVYDYEIKTRTLANLNVEVTNAVYSERDRRVYYCQEGKYFYVKNRVYLTGSDLDKVKKVTYYLHDSFPNPVQVSTDRSNDFEIWIWTWGRFPINAEIEADSGQVFEKSYEFSFKSKYEEAKRRGIPMIRDC